MNLTSADRLAVLVAFLLLTPFGWAIQIMLGYFAWSIIKPKRKD